jgi:hypothetical protein
MPVEPIKDFPSVSEIQDYIESSTAATAPKLPWTRWVIFFLIVLVVLFGIHSFRPVDNAKRSQVTGSITGTITNRQSTPVPADIYILNTELATVSDGDGNFILDHIPGGPQTVIIEYIGIGQGIPVLIENSKTVALGQIQVEVTRVAEQ